MLGWLNPSSKPVQETEPPDWRQEIKKHLKGIKATKKQYESVIELTEFIQFWGSHFSVDMGWYVDEEGESEKDLKMLQMTFHNNETGKQILALVLDENGESAEHPADLRMDPDKLFFAKFAIALAARG